MPTQHDIFALQMILEGCQIYEEIGSSAIGTAYRAVHPGIGNCLLKYLEGPLTENKEFLDSFFQGIAKIKEMEHPNIAKIYRADHKEKVFILRELVLGRSLQEEIEAKQKISCEKATQIVLDISMSLLAGYPFGIVYKNLKPSNIILLPDESVRLVDISLPPTDPHYIPPEVWERKKSDIRSDIYSLGIIYYSMIVGNPPYEEESHEDFCRAHSAKDFPIDLLPSDTPPYLKAILQNMVDKNLENRYHSPVPLIGSLREALKSMGVDVKPVSMKSVSPGNPSADVAPAEETKDRSKMYTGMMVSMSRETAKHNLPTEKVDPAILPTKRVRLEELTKANGIQGLEDSQSEIVYLSNRSLEMDCKKALQRVTFIEAVKERKGAMKNRVVHFPKAYNQQVIDHLQKKFRRECWLLKESDNPGEMEVEIYMEQAYVLQHFYHFEDQLQSAFIEEKTELPSEGSALPGDSGPRSNEMQTIDLGEEEVIQLQEESESLKEKSKDTDDMKTMDISEEECILLQEESKGLLQENRGEKEEEENFKTINDITISPAVTEGGPEKKGNTTVRKRFKQATLEISVDFTDAYQTMGWVKFCREHNLKKGKHFDIKQENEQNVFVLYLSSLADYEREQDHLARIKEFFQADYEISELDSGGMGVVLKLSARNDPTILSLRPENYWARKRFEGYLRVVKDRNNNEIIYAQIPKGTEFVVKVAFEGHEESLIQEARILSHLAEDPNVCETIIGSVQQGRLFALDEKYDQMQIGYYLMLEYASQGNAEQLYRKFPDGKVSSVVAFVMMYGLVQTLQKLKEKGIIHRDIKPHNILMDERGVAKLSDFGLAITTMEESGTLTEERRRLLRMIDEEFLHISTEREQAEKNLRRLEEKKEKLTDDSSDTLEKIVNEMEELKEKIPVLKKKEEDRAYELKGMYRTISAEENASRGKFAGSIYYAAPEQFETDRVLTHQCDVYQLGAVMFTMFTGRRPVEGKSTVEVMTSVLNPVKPKVSEIIKGDSFLQEVSEVIHKMMAYDPEERMSIDQVREEMDRILFQYALELKHPPAYEKTSYVQTPEQEERWKRKVEFAQELHRNSTETIFSTIFQSNPLPALEKSTERPQLPETTESETQEEKIVFYCPHCHKKLHIYRTMEGKKGKCPGCKKPIIVKLDKTVQPHERL